MAKQPEQAKQQSKAKQPQKKAKKLGQGHATNMFNLGWAEAQRIIYADTNVGLQPTVSAGAIKAEHEKDVKEMEAMAQQQPEPQQDNGQEI